MRIQNKKNAQTVKLASVLAIFFMYYFSGITHETYTYNESHPSTKVLFLNSTMANINNITTISNNIVEINNTSLCPVNDTSVIISVKPGGRLGNAVFEYLTVYAWSRDIPNSIPVVPNITLTQLSKVYVNLTIESVESLDQKCVQYKFLNSYNSISFEGNWDLQSLKNKNRKAPLLMVLRRYCVNTHGIWKYWNDLYKEMTILPELVQQSNEKLHKISESFKKQFHSQLEKNVNFEFVGVHVRKTDYYRYLKLIYPKTKAAEITYYKNAMEKMRKMLSPKRAIFVVVSDDMEWCKKQFENINDVTFSGATGDIGNPEEDISTLCLCNHTIMSYGTFGLTSTLCHPKGHVIVFKDENMSNNANRFAKYLNWTSVTN